MKSVFLILLVGMTLATSQATEKSCYEALTSDYTKDSQAFEAVLSAGEH